MLKKLKSKKVLIIIMLAVLLAFNTVLRLQDTEGYALPVGWSAASNYETECPLESAIGPSKGAPLLIERADPCNQNAEVNNLAKFLNVTVLVGLYAVVIILISHIYYGMRRRTTNG